MSQHRSWYRINKTCELYGELHVPPNGEMNILVVMVHGIGEHSGCYVHLAQKFVDQSIGFLAYDLRGHGRSTGVRGHATLKDLKDDLNVIIENMREKFPNIPIVLLGHSMGGQIVTSCAIDQNLDVQGFIASSPWLKLANLPSPFFIRLARWASRIVPQWTVRTGIKANQLTHSGTITKSTKKDPLLHKKISIKLFSDLYANSQMIIRLKNLRLNTPFLMMHSDSDKLVSFRAVRKFAHKNRRALFLKKWSKKGHDLFHDDEKDMIFRYVMYWLSKYILRKWKVSEQL